MDNIDILIKLFVVHAIVDFALQPHAWVKDKNKDKIKSKYLYFHVLLHGVLTYIFVAEWNNFLLPILIIIVHFGIDVFKLYQSKTFKWFLIDQVLHIISIIIIAIFFIHENYSIAYILSITEMFLHSKKFWTIILGYILVLHPTSIMIYQVTKNWQKSIRKAEGKGLKNAGKWIGMIERILILTFILINQFAAVGFLLAAKSIFRFGDLTGKKDRKLTEYVLIGTLLSFAITILIGISIQHIIK
jgi:hypothetical protein